VQLSCYNSSAKVRAWMQQQGFDPSCPPKTAAQLEQVLTGSRAGPCEQCASILCHTL